LEARTISERKREHFSRLSKADQKKEMAHGRTQLSAIFERYTKRMHSLSEFMRGLLQRYTHGGDLSSLSPNLTFDHLQLPFSPLRSGPKAASEPSSQK